MAKKIVKDSEQTLAVATDVEVTENQIVLDNTENTEVNVPTYQGDTEDTDVVPTMEEKAPVKTKKKTAAAKKAVAPVVAPAKPIRDKIVSVTGKKQALTDEDNFRSDLIDITGRSLRSGVVLTDVIEGVEEYPNMVAVVLHHGGKIGRAHV